MKLAFAVSILLMVPAIAETQSATLAPGARVRLTSPSHDFKRHVTTVTDVRGDSIVVGVRGSSRTIALTDVTALEVSTGKQRQFFRNAALGLGIGALTGAVIGAVSYEECVDCWFGPQSAAQEAALGAVLLGTAGLVTGAIVGGFHRTDRWAPVRMPIRAAIGPARSGGVGLTISRTF